PGWPESVCEELRKLSSRIREEAPDVKPEEQRIELTAAADRCDALAAELAAWLGQSIAESVFWIEIGKGPRRRVTLASAPLDVGPTLRRELFDRVPTCVLTSATLCVGSPPRFDFCQTRLGMTRGESLQLGSPFDYPRQAA